MAGIRTLIRVNPAKVGPSVIATAILVGADCGVAIYRACPVQHYINGKQVSADDFQQWVAGMESA